MLSYAPTVQLRSIYQREGITVDCVVELCVTIVPSSLKLPPLVRLTQIVLQWLINLVLFLLEKLTQDMFPSNSSIRSPSPIMSSSLTRRNSSAALLSSLVTPPPDPLIRLCSFCKTILDKQEVQLQLKSNKPVLIQLYEVILVGIKVLSQI